MGLTVGIDWASKEHAVCVLDDAGAVRSRFVVAHSAAGLRELVRRLARFGAPATLPIAVERPSGVLVDTLVEAGHPVVPIHPNALKASRPRYCAAGSQSDAEEAFILADLLRTDGHRYRVLRPLSDETRALRALVRTRDDLVATRVALAHQLRELLANFWPGAAAILAAVDSPIALAFLARYPTPESAERLGAKRLAAFLARHGYCGRRPAAELLDRLHAAPEGCAGEAESDAKGQLVRALVGVLEPLVAALQQLTAAVEHAVAVHPDGAVITSFPRAGKVNAAQILAELGDDHARFTAADQLAVEGGVAPVTSESGKHRAVGWRWACNRRLRAALTCWADNSRHSSLWAAHASHGIPGTPRGDPVTREDAEFTDAQGDETEGEPRGRSPRRCRVSDETRNDEQGMVDEATAVKRQMTPAEMVTAFRENRATERILDRLANHIVVVGFGAIGRLVAGQLKGAGDRVLVVDRDATLAAQASELGHLVVQGDAGVEPGVLDRAGIGHAKALVATTEDPDRKLAITLMAHTLKPDLRIVVTGQNDPRGALLERAGASEVVIVADLVAGALVARLGRNTAT